MAIATAVSIYFFANQIKYVGVVPKHVAAFGDLAFEVGFVLAALLYAAVLQASGRGEGRGDAAHPRTHRPCLPSRRDAA